MTSALVERHQEVSGYDSPEGYGHKACRRSSVTFLAKKFLSARWPPTMLLYKLPAIQVYLSFGILACLLQSRRGDHLPVFQGFMADLLDSHNIPHSIEVRREGSKSDKRGEELSLSSRG